MNKAFKTILIISIAIFGAGVLFIPSVQAGIIQFGDKNIFVDFNGLPFDLSNWAPGMNTPLKTIIITNDEDFDIDVYLKALRISSEPESGEADLADVLTLTIEGQSKYISDLFTENIKLSSVGFKDFQAYNLFMIFDEDAENEYQNKTINFDFIITVEQIGKGGNGEGIPPVSIPGGGGVFIAGLTISNEAASNVEDTSVTINWLTNYFSTSRVIYDTISHSTLGNPPNYGYAFFTPEQDQDPKVSFHSVRIDDLTPENTYFYRTVSRASPEEVSREEHSFTTLTLAEGEREEAIGEEEEEEEEEEIPEGGVTPEVKGEETTGEGVSPVEEGIEEEEEEEEEEEPSFAKASEGKEEEGAGTFLAAIGQFFSGLTLKNLLWILLIIAILLLIVFILSRRRKKKTSENQ